MTSCWPSCEINPALERWPTTEIPSVCTIQEVTLVYDWLEERYELQSVADDVLSKFVPVHVNLAYCFGGLVVVTGFLFQVLVLTGLCLTLGYALHDCSLPLAVLPRS